MTLNELQLLVRRFSTGTLPVEEWTHRAHLAVAIWYLWTHDFDQALQQIRKDIIRYNEAVGTPNTDRTGYHETLTVFWMLLLKYQLLRLEFDSLEAAVSTLLQETYSSKKLPFSYYTRARLISIDARRTWRNGDRKQLSLLGQGFVFQNHYDWTDEEFETLFAATDLEPEYFSHEAHLRLAWIHLAHYGEEQAIRNIRQQLQRYVVRVGAADKYNETLTVAAVKAVQHFRVRAQADNFMDFILEFPRLKYNFKELIGAHYGFDIYESPQAKRQFMEPDLLPFF